MPLAYNFCPGLIIFLRMAKKGKLPDCCTQPSLCFFQMQKTSFEMELHALLYLYRTKFFLFHLKGNKLYTGFCSVVFQLLMPLCCKCGGMFGNLPLKITKYCDFQRVYFQTSSHIYSTLTLVILCHLFHSFLASFLIFGPIDPPPGIF